MDSVQSVSETIECPVHIAAAKQIEGPADKVNEKVHNAAKVKESNMPGTKLAIGDIVKTAHNVLEVLRKLIFMYLAWLDAIITSDMVTNEQTPPNINKMEPKS